MPLYSCCVVCPRRAPLCAQPTPLPSHTQLIPHFPCTHSCSNIVIASDDEELPRPPLPRDLQMWPELIEVGNEVHSSRRKSLYAVLFQGQQAVLKVGQAQ